MGRRVGLDNLDRKELSVGEDPRVMGGGQRQLLIVNQISREFGVALRKHASSPRVIDCLDTERPWDFPSEAEVLVTIPYLAWTSDQAQAAQRPLPNLKWIQLFSTGIERMPRWLINQRMVGCGRGQTSPQIAEFVFAMMLLREKQLDVIRARKPQDWVKPTIGTLQGKTLGIVGFGSIGAEVARRALSFGMNVVACRRGVWSETPEGVTPVRDPTAVVAIADHVVVALPLTEVTRASLNADVLSKAKRGLHLINVSRGAVVVHDDLLALLDAEKIAFASLDVTEPEPLPADHPIWTHERVFLTPHMFVFRR